MPNIVLPIEDTQDSVDRPVIFDIIRQIMEITRISHKTAVNFYGDEGRAAQKNSTIVKDPITENRWMYDEKITIEIEEDFDTNRILNTYVKQTNNLLIFKDNELPVFIRPVYSGADVKITIKYRARDKNQANMWRNDMRTRVAMMRDINLHEIDFHYHLPEEFIFILKEIHRLRENVDGYNESFDDYFVNRLTTKASIVTDMAGKAGIWAIAERQIRVQGYYDFEGVPDKGDKDSDHDNWTTSFTYNFKYEKPIECNMVYPLMVHNQLISSDYRPTDKPYRLEDQLESFTLSGRTFAEFESDKYILQSKGNTGISIPSFDEFIPNNILPSTIRVFTALTSITTKDKRFLFNLKDLGEVGLHSSILKFISQSEYPYMTRAFSSILNLSLYCGSDLINDSMLTIDSNLNVSSVTDLSLRKTYRIRMSLVTDIDYLTKEALIRLRLFPDVASKLITSINSSIVSLGGHSDIGKNGLSVSDIIKLTGSMNAAISADANNVAGARSSAYAIKDGIYAPGTNVGENLKYQSVNNRNGSGLSLVQTMFVVV